MKIRRYLLVIALVLGAGCASAVLWLQGRDPLLSLPLPQHDLKAEVSVPVVQGGRSFDHIILHSATLGHIGIIVSLPYPLPDRPIPVLMMLGGLGTGENNISYLADAGDNAIIGYDWPMPVHFFTGIESLTQMPELYRRVMAVPAQVTSALGWISAEPWADPQRLSLLGFSLGALAAPSIQDVAEHDGQKIGWTILAYGGAPFGSLVAVNPHIKPAWARPALASLIDIVLQPLEPTRHLAHLSGQFLVLEGHGDSLVPAAARLRLQEAVPEPKTIIAFDGEHVGVGADKGALIEHIIKASRSWLAQKGAIDP